MIKQGKEAGPYGDLAAAMAPDLRLLAFMSVSGRDLELHRGAGGATIIPHSSGFLPNEIVVAVKSLLAKDLVTTTLDKEAQTLTVRPKLGPDASRDVRPDAQQPTSRR